MVDFESVDPRSVDWAQVAESAYLVQQRVRYEYPAPISDLHQQLVVLPPRTHGDQRRLAFLVEVSNAEHRLSTRRDAFGNLVVDITVPRVEEAIEFEARTVVERRAGGGPNRVRGGLLQDRRLIDPSPLTMPDDALRVAAAGLLDGGKEPHHLAARIGSWVHQAMTYERGVTSVGTTAAEALHLGRGVCQDYAHVMIAICRLCGIPARYVSGHLLGEGAMHAWVEVILPAGAGDGIAWPFDPTHNRPASMSYITVAVGRDFSDVSPTRGTFRAPASGSLSSDRRVSLTALQLRLI